jgi:glycosyltransferase involved in cell wall biosynthesis
MARRLKFSASADVARPIRVGFIVYGLDRPLTGIGRYTLELARAYATLTDQVEVVLLTAGGIGDLDGTPLERVSLAGCRLLPGLLTIGHVLLPAWARRRRLDVIHDPTAMTPLFFGAGGARIVSTVHDIIPITYPQNSSTLDTLIYTRWLPYKLPHNDAVITVSDYSKRDIAAHWRIAPERIHVVPNGVRADFRPVPEGEARALLARDYGITGRYLLYVGNLTQRKNLESLLRAFPAIRASFPDVRLVIVGPSTFRQTPVGALAESFGIMDAVTVTGAVADSALPSFYSAAEAFVFPSLYEGFGLPPLEAMACGAPVIAANATSLPEVVGDAGVLFDPHDVGALTDAVTRVLSDAALRRDLRARGIARAAGYTWEQSARRHLDVYRALCAPMKVTS